MATFTLTQPRTSANLFLIPNVVGCNTDLTPVGETNNWECIDDPVAVPDGDTTYNYSKATNLTYDLYLLPDHTTEIGAINYVQVFARGKSQTIAQHEDGIYKILITDDACANIYKSDDINLTASSYKTYNKVWTVNPRTASAFLWADIDNVQIGIECSSPSVTNSPSYLTIRPSANGAVQELHPKPSQASYTCVNEEVSDEDDTYLYTVGWEGARYSLFDLDNHTTEAGTIESVSILARIVATDEEASPLPYGRTVINTHATTYYGDINYITEGGWRYINTTYDVNPNTTNVWTWAEVDALLGGVCLFGGGVALDATYCTQIYVVVSYIADPISPEIRTTQCYTKVNYTPVDETCTLNKPEEISVNHAINVKTLNFWDGSREVYGLNRSGKSMVLTGSEYHSDTCNAACPCERIACVRAMGKDGSTITLSGLFSLFNGDYKIRSFGWKHISEKPEYYEWMLELEYDD